MQSIYFIAFELIWFGKWIEDEALPSCQKLGRGHQPTCRHSTSRRTTEENGGCTRPACHSQRKVLFYFHASEHQVLAHVAGTLNSLRNKVGETDLDAVSSRIELGV
jgi:hypothetical protein